MVEILSGANDPRLPVYAQVNDAGNFRGKPAGFNDVPSDDWNYQNVSPLGEFYLRPELPGFFMSYPELKFLMAEAIVKGFISGDATAQYLEGMTASLEFNEVPGPAISTFMANKSLAVGTPAVALEQIATQNWVALFPQGVESWNEWRRTRFPALTPAVDGAINEIPSRYNYPTSEASVNRANYEAAVAAQGADNLTTKIWWMN